MPDIKPCPGCGRPIRTCWTLPCLYLEQIMAQGKAAVRTLLETLGYTVTTNARGDLFCDF